MPTSFPIRLANFLAVQNTYLSTFQTLGGLGLLLGTLGLATVMLRNVVERRSELALLRAIGMTGSNVALIVLSEKCLFINLGTDLRHPFCSPGDAAAPVVNGRGSSLGKWDLDPGRGSGHRDARRIYGCRRRNTCSDFEDVKSQLTGCTESLFSDSHKISSLSGAENSQSYYHEGSNFSPNEMILPSSKNSGALIMSKWGCRVNVCHRRAALSWGVYVPLVHVAAQKLGSNLRAFLFVGVAYFLVAVLIPAVFIFVLDKDPTAKAPYQL